MKVYLGVNEKNYPDGTPLIDVALMNELGTENSPPRPAYKMGAERAIKKNSKLISAFMINMSRDLLNIKGAGKKLVDKRIQNLLTQLGRSGVSEVKNIIKNKELQPNAPATIKKKGFDWPLVETHLELDNVSYLVSK